MDMSILVRLRVLRRHSVWFDLGHLDGTERVDVWQMPFIAEIGRTEMRLQIDRYTMGDIDGVQVGYNRVWM